MMVVDDVVVGRYIHYKGGTYDVTDVNVRHASCNKRYVLYHNSNNLLEQWVRDIVEFASPVDGGRERFVLENKHLTQHEQVYATVKEEKKFFVDACNDEPTWRHSFGPSCKFVACDKVVYSQRLGIISMDEAKALLSEIKETW